MAHLIMLETKQSCEKWEQNKFLKNIKYQGLLKIREAKKKTIPLLNDLIKLSNA